MRKKNKLMNMRLAEQIACLYAGLGMASFGIWLLWYLLTWL